MKKKGEKIKSPVRCRLPPPLRIHRCQTQTAPEEKKIRDVNGAGVAEFFEEILEFILDGMTNAD